VFVSVECEPEVECLEIVSGEVSANVRLVLTCANCSAELAEASTEASKEFDHSHHDENPDNPDDDEWLWEEDDSLELVDDCPYCEVTDRFEGKGRYAKHFYGADVPVCIKCKTCKEEIKLTVNVEEQASSFESLI
jgi:hypothetical protein